jgi:DNA-binding MarR family transcriptional regulator
MLLSKWGNQMRTRGGEAFTQLVLAIFRANGSLIAAGDTLVGELGLSSARWQVLGMIVAHPLTVSAIARRVGIARQSVQRTADRLVEDGFATFQPNPDHATAHLLDLTDHGRAVMDTVGGLQEAWADTLAKGLEVEALKAATALLQNICDRLNIERNGRES